MLTQIKGDRAKWMGYQCDPSNVKLIEIILATYQQLGDAENKIT